MQYFDLHCDTLYKAVTENSHLDNTEYEVSISDGKFFDSWHQCMAIWISDNISDSTGMELFLKASEKLNSESLHHNISLNDSNKKHNLLFTVENGKILSGNKSNIKLLADYGVKMLTLTWNGRNCIGGGAESPEYGLSAFGRQCIPELENNNIIIDVSHASEKTFFDTAQIAKKPFVASHSNSCKLCNHRRNLSDEQFEIISNIGGLVGLNFHRDFLNNSPAKSSVKDVLNHAEHFLGLGGENTLCIGSDFDGSDIPKDLDSITKIPILYESFLKIGYNEQLVQKIMFNNAYNFFSRF